MATGEAGVVKNRVQYPSADGASTVAAFIYTCEEAKPFKAIIQLTHGMAEHIARYDDFAFFLAKNGYIVCGNDDLGHGETVKLGGTKGFFAEKQGYEAVLEDIHQLSKMAVEQYKLPLVLFGHSMGSFFASAYAAKYGSELKALILSGTGGENKQVGSAIMLAKVLKIFGGSKKPSALLDKMAFGAFAKAVANSRTAFDWLSRDEAQVDKYIGDEYCGFTFTTGGFADMFRLISFTRGPQWAPLVPKNLPVYIFSGMADPVGGNGLGVTSVFDSLKKAGVERVSLKLYPEGRHEMLNETNKQDVYTDILNWVDGIISA